MELYNLTWLKQVIEDYGTEASTTGPTVLLRGKGRQAVWVVCYALGFNKCGIPGQACRLFERYLTVCAQHLFAISDVNERRRKENNVMTQMMLYLACSVQLATKMHSSVSGIHSRILQVYLEDNNIYYTIEKIKETELEIYRTLGFKIPMFTCVDAAELLAIELGFSSDVIEHIATLTNLAEYNQDKLDGLIQRSAPLLPKTQNFEFKKLQTLHVSAGCVAACVFYHITSTSGNNDAYITKLVNVTTLPLVYLRCLADTILDILYIPEEDEEKKEETEEPPSKRKKV